MKKIFFVFLAYAGLVLSSCSNDYHEQTYMSMENNKNEKAQSYAQFFASLDSLNAIYQSGHVTRSWRDATIITSADVIGGLAGRWFGASIGGAIGSLSSNPLGAIAGWVIGKKGGASVGSQLFSFVARGFSDMQVSYPDSAHYVIMPVNLNNITTSDSIGYYHNHAMAYFVGHISSFQDVNNAPDYDLIYDYIRNGMTDEQRYYFADDSLFKESIIGLARNNIKAVNSCESLSDYLNTMEEYLVYDVMMDEGDVDYYIHFIRDVINALSTSTTSEIISYSFSLRNVIINSNLDSETKEDTIDTANILLSSLICWK